MRTKILTTIFGLLFLQTLAFAQFTKAQKDSVLNYIDFPRAAYELKMVFRPDAYLQPTYNRLSSVPEKDLNAKLDNSHNDALVYSELASRMVAREGSTPETDELLRKSIEKYEVWLSEDPSNEEANIGVMSAAMGLRDFEKMVVHLNRALENVPKNLEILHSAIFFYLYGGQNFELCQDFIDQALAIDPNNLKTLTYQVSLNEFKFFRGMQDGSVKELDITAAVKAFNENTKNPAYQHLYHFAKVSQVYLYGMRNYIGQHNHSKDVFRNLGLGKEEFETVKAAIINFEEILKLDYNNKDILLNSLGFSHALLGNYESAETSFTALHKAKGGEAGLESLAVLYAFQNKWDAAAEVIEKKVKVSNSIEDYGSLLKAYHTYLKNDEKAKQVVAQIEKSPFNTPTKSQLLCTWFLKKRDVASAEKHIASTMMASEGWKQKLALSVLKDNKQDAKMALYNYATGTHASPEYVALNKYLGL